MTEVNWKWEDFAPKIIQTDKRESEIVAVKGIRMVKKNFNELGISSFMSVPIIDRNRAVSKIVHTFPLVPLLNLSSRVTKTRNL